MNQMKTGVLHVKSNDHFIYHNWHLVSMGHSIPESI